MQNKALTFLTTMLTALALVSSLLASGMGHARAAGGETIIICSDSGPKAIRLSNDGAPLQVRHDCQKCCFGVLASPGNPGAEFTAIPADRNITPISTTNPPQETSGGPYARAPPNWI